MPIWKATIKYAFGYYSTVPMVQPTKQKDDEKQKTEEKLMMKNTKIFQTICWVRNANEKKYHDAEYLKIKSFTTLNNKFMYGIMLMRREREREEEKNSRQNAKGEGKK